MPKSPQEEKLKHIISFDVEVNGRIPGKHSMLQLGAVCFDLKGREISHFVMNLKPLPGAGEDPNTMKWWSDQPKESWESVIKNPVDPKIVTQKFFDWMAQFKKPVLMGAPVAFDFFLVAMVLRDVHRTIRMVSLSVRDTLSQAMQKEHLAFRQIGAIEHFIECAVEKRKALLEREK